MFVVKPRNKKNWILTQEVMTTLSCERKDVVAMVESGELHAERPSRGHYLLIDPQSVEEAARKKGIKLPSPDPPPKKKPLPPEQPPTKKSAPKKLFPPKRKIIDREKIIIVDPRYSWARNRKPVEETVIEPPKEIKNVVIKLCPDGYRIGDVAEALHYSPITIIGWIEAYKIDARLVGNERYILPKSLESFLLRNHKRVIPKT